MTRLLLMEGNPLARRRSAAARGARSPGTVYEDTIARHFPEIAVDVACPADPGDAMPAGKSLSDFDGLVIGGSGLHVYDATPEVTRQIDLLRAFAATGKPIIGCCWGLQIAAVAAGGEVAPNVNGREIVFARKITLTDAGRAHPLFVGKPDSFDAPCIHADEIRSLPAGSTVLCANHHSDVQGALIPLGSSEVWGLQYHPEFDIRHLSDIVALLGDSMIDQGLFADENDRAAYEGKLRVLSDNPGENSIAWQLGINAEILDDRLRSAEIVNWVEHCVLAAGWKRSQ